jgi:uncharacterized protein involved in exopolysaccharide biosynthesis
LLVLANVLLRWRRRILALAFLGAAFGLASALLKPRVYRATATFLPGGSQADGGSGLAAAASQFGIHVPADGGSWGPPVYVKILGSSALLEPIALDTLDVAELGGRRMPFMDLFEIKGSSPALRLNTAVRLLGRIISPREVKALGAVEIAVTTQWPSVSLGLAERALRGVNQFNIETRKSQAAAEARFVGTLVTEAETALRDAEDRFQTFQQRNRVAASPELQFERDRLQREVTIRQEMYTSLLQSREDARIREVRDTPVITVLEDPRLPVLPESRGAALRTVLGFLSGTLVGIIAALFAHSLAGARRTPTEEAREFFELVEQATPRFLRRRHA